MKYLQTALFILFLLVVGSTQIAAKEERVRLASPAAVKERRMEAKERVTLWRDERKKAAVERVQNALDNINARRTEHFSRILERLSEVLAKIDGRTDDAAVQVQIAEAQAAIDTASDAVEVQAAKDYTIEVTDESTAKTVVGGVFRQLQADLNAVGDLVRAARTAVQEAHRALVDTANNE